MVAVEAPLPIKECDVMRSSSLVAGVGDESPTEHSLWDGPTSSLPVSPPDLS